MGFSGVQGGMANAINEKSTPQQNVNRQNEVAQTQSRPLTGNQASQKIQQNQS